VIVGTARLIPTVDEVPWDAHIRALTADAPDQVSIRWDIPSNLCQLFLSFMKYPTEALTHDGNGELLSEVDYKDLAVELEHMYRKEHGSLHTHTAGRAVPPIARAGCSPPAGECPQGWVHVGRAHVCVG
jgi:hypothetical protein